MDRVEVDVSGLVKAIEAVARKIDNFEPIAAEVAEMLVAGVNDLVESEGDGAWAPMTADTLRLRRESQSSKLLQDTGHMVGGIVPSHDGTSASASSPAAYAGFHVQGTKHMPARDFLAVADDDAFMEAVIGVILREALP